MVDALARGRRLHRQLAWRDAYEALSDADRARSLGAEDLELLATSAYLSGRDDEALDAFERGHQEWLVAGEGARAARCAFWLGLHLLLRGEPGRASGWLQRGQRLVDGEQRECVERGYLQLPAAERYLEAGDHEAAYTAAARAAEIGERFGEGDLTASARHVQGRALLRQGRLRDGLALLDEVMVAVTGGELSPVMSGLVYCSVIAACAEVYALDRAREWTAALSAWCERQPQLQAFTATCRVHRSEVLLWCGEWRQALAEARSACRRSAGHEPAAAFYQQGEVHRLEGELEAAEAAYAVASRGGCEPQPGLALLRLAQGRTDTALAAIQRAVGVAAEPLARTRLLPAYVEILLAVDDVEGARTAARELTAIAASLGSEVIEALAAQSRGAVELAAGDARTAIGSLRRAQEIWQRLEAPYPTARARELIGLACAAVGDQDGSELELDAARALFERLGAASGGSSRRPAVQPSGARGLTARELEVLRLIASGATNKRIATDLGLSARTVDRHVSNIFGKLDVSTRTAATAHAYEHGLL